MTAKIKYNKTYYVIGFAGFKLEIYGGGMIEITKMNNTQVLLNCDLIECIEEAPDTTITMVNNKKYVVKESAEELYKRVVEYRRKLLSQGIIRL